MEFNSLLCTSVISLTIYLPDRLMVNKDIDLYQYEPMRVNSNIVQL